MAESAVNAVNASMLHTYEVMKRQSVAYDYEKVFYNSLFGVGIVGVGWLALKVGQMIRGVQKPVDEVIDVISDPERVGYYTYRYLWDWVEGPHKDEPVWNALTVYWGILLLYRGNVASWTNYKTGVVTSHPEWFASDSDADTGKPARSTEPVDRLLEGVDSVYAKWGAAAPLLLVGGNVGLEYLRVHKLKRELR